LTKEKEKICNRYESESKEMYEHSNGRVIEESDSFREGGEKTTFRVIGKGKEETEAVRNWGKKRGKAATRLLKSLRCAIGRKGVDEKGEKKRKRNAKRGGP